MHVISGLKKRAVASVMEVAGVTGESGAAKKPTAKEMREQCGKAGRRGAAEGAEFSYCYR